MQYIMNRRKKNDHILETNENIITNEELREIYKVWRLNMSEFKETEGKQKSYIDWRLMPNVFGYESKYYDSWDKPEILLYQ